MPCLIARIEAEPEDYNLWGMARTLLGIEYDEDRVETHNQFIAGLERLVRESPGESAGAQNGNTDVSTVDTRSIDELFAAATDWSLAGGEGDRSAFAELKRGGSLEIFDRAIALTWSDDFRERTAGAHILGSLGEEEDRNRFREQRLTAILRLMRDGNAKVLGAAAVGLAYRQDPRAVPALIAHRHHDDKGVRMSVAAGLCEQSGPVAIEALIEMMEDPEPGVRDWATFALGLDDKVDHPEVRAAVRRRLDDPDDKVRNEALKGLARCRDLSVVPHLIARMKATPKDNTLWDMARSFLGSARDQGKEDTDGLLIADLERLIGGSAGGGVGGQDGKKVKRPEDTRSVDELFAAATDWSLKEGEGDSHAYFELQRRGGREILDRAIALTKSVDARERERGADILGQLGYAGDPNAFLEERLTAVLRLMQDSAGSVLRAATAALGHIKDPRGVPAVLPYIHHEDKWVRYSVTFVLAGRSEPEAIRALITMMEDSEPLVRDWATFALGQQGTVDTPEIRAALHRRMDDPDDQVRMEALEGLARCGDLSVVPFLIGKMKEEPFNFSLMLPATALLKVDRDTRRSMNQFIADLE